MLFQDINRLAIEGTRAVKKMRNQKHLNGHPFMINSKDLPAGQCYLEFPDGKMFLVSLDPASERNYRILKELSPLESKSIREKFHLL